MAVSLGQMKTIPILNSLTHLTRCFEEAQASQYCFFAHTAAVFPSLNLHFLLELSRNSKTTRVSLAAVSAKSRAKSVDYSRCSGRTSTTGKWLRGQLKMVMGQILSCCAYFYLFFINHLEI